MNSELFKGKVLVLYGARQVGKTTLVQHLLSNHSNARYLNCDEPDIRQALTNKTSTELKSFLGDQPLIILDEAQRIPNCGLTLKLLIDTYPHLQLIATGSSSFELSGNIKEPLTGRKRELYLHPLSLVECAAATSKLEEKRLLEHRMVYGLYPAVVTTGGQEAQTVIKDLANSYLFKDILMLHKVRNPEILERLLQALALQLGQQVSFTELSQLLGIDKNTVASYIRILEQSFVIFRLPSFNRNLRNELKHARKIYFYDNGIRNAVLNHFAPLSLRQDVGALWENLMISERMKCLANQGKSTNGYFWRTHQQQEVDYIEEHNGHLQAFEMKWNPTKSKKTSPFSSRYPEAQFTTISPNNFWEFITQA